MDNLILAFYNARKGKKWYTEVREIEDNLDFYLTELQNMLINKIYKTSDYIVFTKLCGTKEREIYKLPFFPDRICQWAIIQVVEPILLNQLNGCTHSAIPGHGIHSAFLQVDKYMKDEQGTKYCLKLDIQKFYPSIRHDLLKNTYRTMFKDPDLLWLIDEIIDSSEGDRGVPIGNYLSQYSGNLFLSKFDRWLKEELRVKYYTRYMDDIVIFHNDKQYLHDLLNKIRHYLEINLDLEIKDNYQVFPSRVRGVDFVGYRHFGSYVLLRKSIALRLKRRMASIKKNIDNGNPLTYSDYCSIYSYKGWLEWCNGHNLYVEWIKPLEPYYDKYYREVIRGENIS